MNRAGLSTTLTEIQRLQFRDRARAQDLLLTFLRAEVPDIEALTIQTKPESLNSINGILVMGGRDFFFKTHTEEHETEVSESSREFYNSTLLEEAGYPVVVPKMMRHMPGRQVAIYEKVEMATLFDLTKQAEDLQLAGQVSPLAERMVAAQERLDQNVLSVYFSTLHRECESTLGAPIHQLFSERLQSGRRVDDFYAGRLVDMPWTSIAFDELCKLRWTINGVEYSETIGELIESARQRLMPSRVTPVACGHGDAHNGNVWFDEQASKLWYFDPAFAGHHSPLLDLVKPVFHNTFARWMYHPEEVDSQIEVKGTNTESTIEVEHNFKVSSIRERYLDSKTKHVVRPLVEELQQRRLLEDDWTKTLKLALFCCPFLTVNLAAPYDKNGKLDARYSAAIKLLGLAMAVEMGATPIRGSNAISDSVGRMGL